MRSKAGTRPRYRGRQYSESIRKVLDMDRLRAVVCGATFGRLYAAGLRLRPLDYELVGMLSRGSEQSRDVARRQAVPLCTDIEDLPDHDVAFVVVRSGVMGGEGTRLAQRLLAAGKHVVMEHPVHRSDAVSCYREAAGSGRAFIVNSFYRHSSTIRTFLKLAEALRIRYGVIHVQAECSIQFLFSMIDIVGRVTGGFSPWSLDPRGAESEVFTSVHGSFRGVPVTLRVVNTMSASSPDDFVHAGHRLSVFTSAGTLVLTETDGRIIWHPNILSPRDGQGVLDVDADERLSSAALHEELAVEADVTRRSLFERVWPDAVAELLDEALRQMNHPGERAHEAEYTLALCSVWARVGGLLGPSRELGSQMPPDHLCLARLMEYAGVGAGG